MADEKIRISMDKIVFAVVIAGAIGLVLLFWSNSSGKSGRNVNESGDKVVAYGQEKSSDSGEGDGFVGEAGKTVKGEDGVVYIDEVDVNDGNMHAYNYWLESQQKNIYFFVVQASDGTYRAAANACEVCYGAKKGFSQVGDLIRCDNCQVTYPKDKIALEKGGCNPGPINKDVEVENGRLVIKVAELEEVAYLF